MPLVEVIIFGKIAVIIAAITMLFYFQRSSFLGILAKMMILGMATSFFPLCGTNIIITTILGCLWIALDVRDDLVTT